MKVAIFGGTFDPIHCAHLEVARAACEKFGLDRVLFVPAANPPHKRHGASAPYEDRLRMVQLACEGDPRFVASDLEAGAGKSYSINTIERVRAQLPAGDELLFIIGADAFAEIGTWYRWEDVVREVAFIVVTRPGHHYEIPRGARVLPLDDVCLPVSSSEIRMKLESGADVPELPPAVLAFVRERGLYKKAGTARDSAVRRHDCGRPAPPNPHQM